MSWDADLIVTRKGPCSECGAPDRESDIGVESWNYTHNTNGMIAAAYEAATGAVTEQASGPLGPVIGAAWWKRLDGSAGDEGAAYLAQIVGALEADPDRFRAMDPPNGWGSYDTLLPVLRQMRDCVALYAPPMKWSVSG